MVRRQTVSALINLQAVLAGVVMQPAPMVVVVEVPQAQVEMARRVERVHQQLAKVEEAVGLPVA